MGVINSIKITREELDNGIIPFNHVMVEADKTIEGKKTKGGIIYGHDENVQFEGEGTSWEADVADVFGTVYKIPQKLYYDKEDPNHSMSWYSEMEVQIGDLVWFSVIEGRNATALECDGKFYKIIPYADLIVCRRTLPFNNTPADVLRIYQQTGQVLFNSPNIIIICLNGRVLLEYYKKPKVSSLDFKEEIDTTKGIVRFLGKPNKEYIREEYNDIDGLEVGDLVLLNPGTPQVPLERRSFNSHFDNGKLYFVVQRRRIAMILSKGN
jgi:hypothetical protein